MPTVLPVIWGSREKSWAPPHPKTFTVMPAGEGPSPFLFWSLPPHCGPLTLLLCPPWVPAWAWGAIH